ncbi:MAG: hypothetical protein ACOZB3_04295 [Calditrichota bacterium]
MRNTHWLIIALVPVLMMPILWGNDVGSGRSLLMAQNMPTATAPLVTSDNLYEVLATGEVSKGYLPLYAMAFGIFTLIVLFLLACRKAIGPRDMPRYFILTLIIISALIFIVGRFENSDIAPAIGLFGTIAGYVLGRSDRKEEERETHPAPAA